jgi:DNA primase
MFEGSREDVAGVLMHLGVGITKSWHFSDDKSFSIKKNGYIRDYGRTAFEGDIIAYLQEFHNMDFLEAKNEAYRLSGLPMPDFTEYKKSEEYIDRPISQNYIDAFMQESLIHKRRVSIFLKVLFPGVEEGKREAFASKHKIGYSLMADRLIMPVYELDGTVINLWKYNPFKYRDLQLPRLFNIDLKKATYKMKYGHLKVKYTKNRKRVPLFLSELSHYNAHPSGIVFVLEGEKDMMNMLIRGFKAVTMGGASMTIPPEYRYLFIGLNIQIVYDHDEAGYRGGVMMYNQLLPLSRSIRVTDWVKKQRKEGFLLKRGFDCTDYCILKGL